MPHFTEQDRPKKVKEIYKALKRDHPDMPAEMKARIAARQGKPGKQHQGPPYKAPINETYQEKKGGCMQKLAGCGIGLKDLKGKYSYKNSMEKKAESAVDKLNILSTVGDVKRAGEELEKKKGNLSGTEKMIRSQMGMVEDIGNQEGRNPFDKMKSYAQGKMSEVKEAGDPISKGLRTGAAIGGAAGAATAIALLVRQGPKAFVPAALVNGLAGAGLGAGIGGALGTRKSIKNALAKR